MKHLINPPDRSNSIFSSEVPLISIDWYTLGIKTTNEMELIKIKVQNILVGLRCILSMNKNWLVIHKKKKMIVLLVFIIYLFIFFCKSQCIQSNLAYTY